MTSYGAKRSPGVVTEMFSIPATRMPKRKYPFEDCCNFMRQMKMHVVQSAVSNMEEAVPSFNSSCCHSAMVDPFRLNSSMSSDPFTQGSTTNRKIQLFVNFRGQLIRTTPPPLPSRNLPTQTCCHSCRRPDALVTASSRHCHFCEKLVCDSCIQLCVNCKEEFCVLCSIKVYRPKEDVTFCLSCS